MTVPIRAHAPRLSPVCLTGNAHREPQAPCADATCVCECHVTRTNPVSRKGEREKEVRP